MRIPKEVESSLSSTRMAQLVPAFPARNHFDAERSGSSTTDYETANVSLEFVVKSTAV